MQNFLPAQHSFFDRSSCGKRLRNGFLLYLSLVTLAGCSPLTSSPYDGKYQLELTLHEVQTNLDDLRHDLNSFRTELQIVEGRIKHYEDALVIVKSQDLEKQQAKIDQLASDIQLLEKKWSAAEKSRLIDSSELRQLATFAKEAHVALVQFKDRIAEMEQDVISGQRRFDEIGKLKGNIDTLARAMRANEQKSYRVRPGDSLEKIAKSNKTTVEKIKKLNALDHDLIVVGQELKLPSE